MGIRKTSFRRPNARSPFLLRSRTQFIWAWRRFCRRVASWFNRSASRSGFVWSRGEAGEEGQAEWEAGGKLDPAAGRSGGKGSLGGPEMSRGLAGQSYKDSRALAGGGGDLPRSKIESPNDALLRSRVLPRHTALTRDSHLSREAPLRQDTALMGNAALKREGTLSRQADLGQKSAAAQRTIANRGTVSDQRGATEQRAFLGQKVALDQRTASNQRLVSDQRTASKQRSTLTSERELSRSAALRANATRSKSLMASRNSSGGGRHLASGSGGGLSGGLGKGGIRPGKAGGGMLRRTRSSRRSRGGGRGFASRPRFAFVRCVLVALALWVFVPYLFTGLETIGLLESRLPEYAVETGAPVGAGSGQEEGQKGGQGLAAESKGGLTSYWKALWGRMLSKGEEKPRGLQNLNQLPEAWQSFNSGVKIKLYEYQSQQLMEMDLEEYVVGVVAGEMPASFGLEALKAQAVAARTYGVSRMVKGASPALAEIQPAANVTNDHNINQAWIGEQERRKRWGSQFDEYEGKIRQAVGETLGVILLYEGEVTDPLYHASCGGEKTEAAVNVWGRSVPYLQAVECSGHQEPHTEKVTLVKFQDADRLLGTTLSAIPAGASLSGSNMCQVTGRTDSGRVLSASILGQEFTGTQLRSALGLPSANFQARLTAEGLEVISKGYGHGVGMCQYGANDLANKGVSWQDILKRYYVGAYVAKMSAR